jgi:hypothetical protein
MDPDIDVDGEMAAIMAELARKADAMTWKCPRCGITSMQPMRSKEVDEVKAFVRRKKKKWWQFWIR